MSRDDPSALRLGERDLRGVDELQRRIRLRDARHREEVGERARGGAIHPVALDDVARLRVARVARAQVNAVLSVLDAFHEQVDPLVGAVQEQLAKARVGRVRHDLPRHLIGDVVAHQGLVEEGPLQHPVVVSAHTEHVGVNLRHAVRLGEAQRIALLVEDARGVASHAHLGL